MLFLKASVSTNLILVDIEFYTFSSGSAGPHSCVGLQSPYGKVFV
jgi:hypothetical protein